MFKENKYYATFTAKVIYDVEQQLVLIIKDINEFYYELCNTLSSQDTIDYGKLAQTVRDVLFFKIMHYSFFFKKEEYKKEDEYRVIFTVSNNLEKYRECKGIEIPYIEVELEENSILRHDHSKTIFI